MLAAQQKRKENIAEYFLYLFQIEDLIRAYRFDVQQIENSLVSQYKTDDTTRVQIADWYRNLVKMMEKEALTQSGHLQFLVNLINDVNEFHLKLMEMRTEMEYVNLFQSVSGLITELNRKNNSEKNDVLISLDAIYGFLLLKIQKKEVTVETTDAIKRLSGWLSLLSKFYKDFEAGDFDIE